MGQQQEHLNILELKYNKISHELALRKINCCDIFLVFANFLTWFFIFLLIYDSERNFYNYIIFGSISYIICLISEFISTAFEYLRTKDNKMINEKMGDIYKISPSITLTVECYHTENYGQNARQLLLMKIDLHVIIIFVET